MFRRYVVQVSPKAVCRKKLASERNSEFDELQSVMVLKDA